MSHLPDDVFDLEPLDKPLGPIRLPKRMGGGLLDCHEPRMMDLRLLTEAEQTGDAEKMRQAVRRCVPDLTDELYDELGPAMVRGIVNRHLLKNVFAVMDELKNDAGDAATARPAPASAPASPPSKRTTSSRTPRPASPSGSAAAG